MKTNVSTNPQNRTGRREFRVNRDHTVGQFLKFYPDANRTMKRLAVEAESWNTLGDHIRAKGYGA